MFNSLTGEITHAVGTTVRLQTGGVEWQLEAPAGTVAAMTRLGHERVRVFVHLHHREDSMTLYGFAAEAERAVFLELIRIAGIGPKQAIRILSGTSLDSFVAMLEAGNLEALATIPGLGKKTAQKIVLALQGKLVSAEAAVDGGAGSQAGGGPHAELVTALYEMGFDRKAAGEAIEHAMAGLQSEDMEPALREQEAFRRAIIALS